MRRPRMIGTQLGSIPGEGDPASPEGVPSMLKLECLTRTGNAFVMPHTFLMRKLCVS